MQQLEMVLNIRYDAPAEIWDKIPSIYSQLNGWLGYGNEDNAGERGIPYWFSYNEDDKHIRASVEIGGLQFVGVMEKAEWMFWKSEIKRIATIDWDMKWVKLQQERSIIEL